MTCGMGVAAEIYGTVRLLDELMIASAVLVQ